MEAMKDVEDVFNIDINYAKAYSLKGEILYNQKDYPGALKSYEEALMKPDPPAQAIIGKSKSMNQLGNSKEAYRILDEAILKQPASAEFYYARGMLNNAKERYSRSLSDFDKALAVNPNLNPFGNYLNRGIAYLNLEEQESAIKDLSQAIVIDPKSATAYHSRGLAHYQTGDYKESVEDFLKSSELSPNNPVTYYNLGMAYFKLGDKENACVYFHKSCQLENNNSCKMIILNCSERGH
jgi:tetratricopeptide (TPR) repeat protein